MDVFMEYLIKRKRDAKYNILSALLIFSALIVTIVLLFVTLALGMSMGSADNGAAQFSSMFSGIGLLLIAGVWYGAYILINRRSIEYEYILTNSEMDVDKIMAKKRRKRMVSFDFKDAEIVADISDNMHNAEYKNAPENIKVMDFTGNKSNGRIYFADVMIEGEQKRILFQPTSKMLDSIKRYNPRKVFIKEEY